MFWIILRRELQEGLTSFTFMSALAVLTALVPLTAYTQARFHQQVIADHGSRQILHRAETRSGVMILTRSVPPLLPVFNGLYSHLPDEITLIRESASGTPSTGDLKPLDWLFPKVDLSMIIGVLMTLMAILLAHDAVTGEKEQGTLRLVLSDPVARRTVLGAKLIAVVLLLVLSVIYAVLLYTLLAAVFSAGMFELSATRFIELAAAALVGLLTVIVFATLGLAVSTLVQHSSMALALSLVVWVAAVLVWPSVVPYLASSLWPVPSRQAARRQLLAKEAQLIREELSEHRKAAAELKARKADVEVAWQKYLEIKRRWSERKREELGRLAASRQRLIWDQQKGTIGLLLVSPYGSFKVALGSLCGTGLEDYQLFVGSAERYEVEEFIPASFEALTREKPWITKTGDAQELQPRPFQAPTLSFKERLRGITLPVGLLILESGVLTAFSLFKFDRYDVR